SLAGAAAANGTALLLSRFAEGVGFLMAAFSIPSLIARLARPADVKLAFALWGTYMPAGQALMLLASPVLPGHGGWRGLWRLAGAAAAHGAALLLSRFADGVGFLMAAVTIPSLIARLARPADVKLAFALWGTYMPAGQALMQLASPVLLGLVGSRGLWLVYAA